MRSQLDISVSFDTPIRISIASLSYRIVSCLGVFARFSRVMNRLHQNAIDYDQQR